MDALIVSIQHQKPGGFQKVTLQRQRRWDLVSERMAAPAIDGMNVPADVKADRQKGKPLPWASSYVEHIQKVLLMFRLCLSTSANPAKKSLIDIPRGSPKGSPLRAVPRDLSHG